MNTLADIAWAAGLFDGEGCVFMSRQKRLNRPSDGYALKLSMSMVHKPTLQEFAKVVQRGAVVVHRSGRSRVNRRDSWQWAVYNAKAIEVLKLLLPYLRTKHEEALLGLRFEGLAKTSYPKGGRTEAVAEQLESLRQALRRAKRYEWPHGSTTRTLAP